MLHTPTCRYNGSFRNSIYKRWIALASNADSTSSSFLLCSKNGKSFFRLDQEKPDQADRLCSVPQGHGAGGSDRSLAVGVSMQGVSPLLFLPGTDSYRLLLSHCCWRASAQQGKGAWRKYYGGKKFWYLPARTLLVVEVGCLETPVTPQPHLSAFSWLFSPGIQEAQQKQRFLIALFLKQSSLIPAEWAETLINLEQGGRNV